MISATETAFRRREPAPLHTEKDTPEQVDPETVEQVARFLAAVAEGLGY